ncbi:2-hydroxyacylsphingosine 1-beta-galactosyltransferase isoform X2 [Mobula hypostoma]|uniref:2-hydroxyacylsphingosine 1-beta-galactosyltransferase isoform X2 n=1 Tax=Mobula hypostoma TaxID=723540 RepID=UPI002FC301BF
MKWYFQILTLVCCFVKISKAAKIVVVPPIMFESHLYIFKTLAKALHEDGHEMVFAVSEGREIPSSDYFRLLRYPGFFNSTTADDFLQSKMRNIFSGRLTALELFDILEHYSKNCDIMVGSQSFIAQLKEEKFDLLLVDPNEMCGFVIAHLLGVKYAVFSTGLWYPAEDFMIWADGAKDEGFVLVSFGAGVKYLSDEVAHTLAGALARLPQRVMWRYSGKKPSNLSNNTRLVEWVPQNDLLGHPNIRGFLSHGGLNGIFEAMYHGVPVVGIPLFGDHYDTMTRVHAKGMGISLNWKTMTEDDLYNAMVTIITDPRYKQRAEQLSQIHKDQPEHPVNRTVYWINYILRYRGAAHLRAAVYNIQFYQYYLLDAFLLIAISVIVAFKIGFWIVNWVTRRFSPKLLQSKANGCCCNGIPNGKHRKNGHIKHEKKVK